MMLKIFLGISVFFLLISTYFCVKFALIILKIQETIEQSLDTLDEKYGSMSEILNRPLFYDSPEVRRVLKDIDASRSAVHEIAFSLTQNFEQENQDEG